MELIYKYNDYKSYVKMALTEKGHGSRIKFAQALNCQSAYITQVLNKDAHLSMEQAWELSQRLGARQTYLIHMDHTVDYDIWNERCPEGIALAYDALTVHTEFHPSV